MKASAEMIAMGSAVMTLRVDGHIWDAARVYAAQAPQEVIADSAWVVCTILNSEPGPVYPDGVQTTAVEIAAQAISSDPQEAELASREILLALQDKGTFDTTSPIAIPTAEEVDTDDWQILTITAGRAIRLDPRQDTVLRFYERGYVFEFQLQDSNAKE